MLALEISSGLSTWPLPAKRTARLGTSAQRHITSDTRFALPDKRSVRPSCGVDLDMLPIEGGVAGFVLGGRCHSPFHRDHVQVDAAGGPHGPFVRQGEARIRRNVPLR